MRTIVAGIPTITQLDRGNVECPTCAGEGWVCENHPDRAWDYGEQECCGGAGAPCKCNPLSWYKPVYRVTPEEPKP